ncbi:hypothetical protein BU16DRAFT_566664 [Lophium mytilinum]|uniref:CCHC-type domain-containing protein n=1 Tax=Lophium mytilinum TaxID=390894 RepID=A0A6A6QER0_9PEZI|nr:hypothetical protein BU16DRAFT_566664 [Lophium mytilinum]
MPSPHRPPTSISRLPTSLILITRNSLQRAQDKKAKKDLLSKAAEAAEKQDSQPNSSRGSSKSRLSSNSKTSSKSSEPSSPEATRLPRSMSPLSLLLSMGRPNRPIVENKDVAVVLEETSPTSAPMSQSPANPPMSKDCHNRQPVEVQIAAPETEKVDLGSSETTKAASLEHSFAKFCEQMAEIKYYQNVLDNDNAGSGRGLESASNDTALVVRRQIDALDEMDRAIMVLRNLIKSSESGRDERIDVSCGEDVVLQDEPLLLSPIEQCAATTTRLADSMLSSQDDTAQVRDHEATNDATHSPKFADTSTPESDSASEEVSLHEDNIVISTLSSTPALILTVSQPVRVKTPIGSLATLLEVESEQRITNEGEATTAAILPIIPSSPLVEQSLDTKATKAISSTPPVDPLLTLHLEAKLKGEKGVRTTPVHDILTSTLDAPQESIETVSAKIKQEISDYNMTVVEENSIEGKEALLHEDASNEGTVEAKDLSPVDEGTNTKSLATLYTSKPIKKRPTSSMYIPPNLRVRPRTLEVKTPVAVLPLEPASEAVVTKGNPISPPASKPTPEADSAPPPVRDYEALAPSTSLTTRPAGSASKITLGHVNCPRMNPKQSQERRARLMKEGKCFQCEEKGHMTRDCPTKPITHQYSKGPRIGAASHHKSPVATMKTVTATKTVAATKSAPMTKKAAQQTKVQADRMAASKKARPRQQTERGAAWLSAFQSEDAEVRAKMASYIPQKVEYDINTRYTKDAEWTD